MNSESLPTGHSLPGGVVTLLLTDIEDSSRLWEQQEEAMGQAVARHEQIIDEILARQEGHRVKDRGEGDSQFLVFTNPEQAVRVANALQQAFHAEVWPEPIQLRVRIALHTGQATLRDNDYFGPVVNRCARLRGIGHGGQTLLAQATAELVQEALPEECSLRDLGPHRLKDLLRPETVFQLCHPLVSDTFPPLRSLTTLPHNLPLQLTSFIGREREMAQIRRLLQATRFLTLMGSGGAGKTRLALQVAADLHDHYTDGVRLVEFVSLTDPTLVPQAIANVVGVREMPGQDFQEQLLAALAPKSLLLILDNCEHLWEAIAHFSDTLLKRCPNVHLLATSRIQMNVAGEVTWRVPSLPLLDAKALPSFEQTAQNDAVRLFTERAQAASPNFQLTEQNIPDVVRICNRLDGMPYGLELVAAKVPMLTVRQIADRLDKSFRDLKDGAVNKPLRQRTMEAMIGWSHDLLKEPQRVLLRRLSVFAGGWTLEAAEAVCGEDDDSLDVLDGLMHLERASLIVVTEQENANRYRLLQTVREYADSRLKEAGEIEPLRDRHLRFYLGLAEEAEPCLIGPQQSEWLQRLQTEYDNLRLALQMAFDTDTRLRLANALWRFWLMRGYLEEGRGWLENALMRRGSDPAVRAKALNGTGVIATRQGDYARAKVLLEECLSIRRAAEDDLGAAIALTNLAAAARRLGDDEFTLTCFEEALFLSRKIGNQNIEAAVLNNLSSYMIEQDNLTAARARFEQALTIYERLGDHGAMAMVHNNIGELAREQRDLPAARHHLDSSLALKLELENWGVMDTTLRNLGFTLIEIGDYEDAARLLAVEDNIRKDSGNSIPTADKPEYDACLVTLQAHLGEENFTQLWQSTQCKDKVAVLLSYLAKNI